MVRRNTQRKQVIGIEELGELLHLPKHEARALIANFDEVDGFPSDWRSYKPRLRREARPSASQEGL